MRNMIGMKEEWYDWIICIFDFSFFCLCTKSTTEMAMKNHPFNIHRNGKNDDDNGDDDEKWGGKKHYKMMNAKKSKSKQ